MKRRITTVILVLMLFLSGCSSIMDFIKQKPEQKERKNQATIEPVKDLKTAELNSILYCPFGIKI